MADTSLVSVMRQVTPPETRFWAKVVQSGECWLWTGAALRSGYGVFGRGRRGSGTTLSHRWAYEHMVAEIPEGLVIDHLCRNPSCVNPYHMEPVTQRMNVLRGDAPARLAQMRATDQCHKGHRFTPENTRTDKRGRRTCKTCYRVYDRERKRQLRRAQKGVI